MTSRQTNVSSYRNLRFGNAVLGSEQRLRIAETILDLPGKSGEHQLRNQEVFYVQRETTDAGISA